MNLLYFIRCINDLIHSFSKYATVNLIYFSLFPVDVYLCAWHSIYLIQVDPFVAMGVDLSLSLSVSI